VERKLNATMEIPKHKLIKEARKHGYSDMHKTPQSLQSIFDWIERRPLHVREDFRALACLIINFFAIKLAKEAIKSRRKK